MHNICAIKNYDPTVFLKERYEWASRSLGGKYSTKQDSAGKAHFFITICLVSPNVREEMGAFLFNVTGSKWSQKLL